MPDLVYQAVPLPRVICKLLYTFCKVRGQKVIVRFLNNEPRHLQPMITALDAWESVQITRPQNGDGSSFVWEEKYIMLLWLSHLMLIPFDLATAAYGDAITSTEVQTNFSSNLPPVTLSVLALGLRNLDAAGKERESASALLVRLALRPDMRRAGVLDDLVRFALSRLTVFTDDPLLSVYHLLGTLSILSGLFNSGSDEEVAPLIEPCFRACHKAASGESQDLHSLNTSASSRKLLIKILRCIVLKSILIGSKGSSQISGDILSSMIEDAVDYFLTALADKDTPIRFAAGKALSMITLKLESSMAEEIVEAVIGSLSENMLYEMPGSGKLVTAMDLLGHDETLKPNLTAVDPLRWQGLMLTLAHLLFRRCPPTHQLPDILKALLSGLVFEQRSATGISVGTGVRDAACFGVWALSRKYNTSELLKVDLKGFHYPHLTAQERLPDHIIQILACQLVVSACLDPSGNIRRGSSAALQELIGRHPDTVENGISLVQIVDYHSVARRSRAILEVAVAAAKLSPLYQAALQEALYDWRGIKAADAESRRTAATAIGNFCRLTESSSVDTTTDYIMRTLVAFPVKGSGAILELRHGFLLALANTISPQFPLSRSSHSEENTNQIQSIIGSFTEHSTLLGKPLKRSQARSELVFEATSSLINSLCRIDKVRSKAIVISEEKIDFMVARLNVHLESENDVVVETSTDAIKSLFRVISLDDQDRIIKDWLDVKKRNLNSFSSKGRISALGALASELQPDARTARPEAVAQLQNFVEGPWPVEVRIAALRSLADACINPGTWSFPLYDSFADHGRS